jgi:DNA-binding transcriptional ArsR family regulator
MVVDAIDTTDEELDRLFHALADATRRDVILQVMGQEQSISTLAGRYAMSFAAVQKHVAVLERAALVSKRRSGREQIVAVEIDAIRRADRLLRDYEDLWRHRAEGIAALLAEPDTAPTGESTP